MASRHQGGTAEWYTVFKWVHMHLISSILSMIFLLPHVGSATVLFIVGTKDGRLVCEDTRLTRTIGGKVTYDDSVHKTQLLSTNILFSAVGNLTRSHEISPNVWSEEDFNILEAVPKFFTNNNPEPFGRDEAWKFQNFVSEELQKGSVKLGRSSGELKTLIVLNWVDGKKNIQTDETKATDQINASPFARRGGRLADATFITTRPMVYGEGQRVYQEIREGKMPDFDAIRKDTTLRIFLSDNLGKDSVSGLSATASIKRLITIISEKQDLVGADINVGPTSDCFLLSTDGVKDMNEALQKEQAEQLKKPTQQTNKKKRPKK
jgi:hypothetical protein